MGKPAKWPKDFKAFYRYWQDAIGRGRREYGLPDNGWSTIVFLMEYFDLPWEPGSFGIALFLAAKNGWIRLPGPGSGRLRGSGVPPGRNVSMSTPRKRRERIGRLNALSERGPDPRVERFLNQYYDVRELLNDLEYSAWRYTPEGRAALSAIDEGNEEA